MSVWRDSIALTPSRMKTLSSATKTVIAPMSCHLTPIWHTKRGRKPVLRGGASHTTTSGPAPWRPCPHRLNMK